MTSYFLCYTLKSDWKKCDFSWRLNADSLSIERICWGRKFQVDGAETEKERMKRSEVLAHHFTLQYFLGRNACTQCTDAMRPIATDVARRRGLSVCMSVCLCAGHKDVLCKNGWTDRDAVWRIDSCGSKESFNLVLYGVDIFHRKEQFWGLSGQLKSIGNLCWGVRSKPDRSIFNNGTIVGLLTAANSSAVLVGVILHCPREKSVPCGSAFRINSVTTC